MLTSIRALLGRFLTLFTASQADRRLDEELQSHLDLLVEQNLARGMSPADARRAAHISLGGSDQIKESVRDHRGFLFLDSLAQDLRFAARQLRKSPGFTAIAILTLALGIGANTAIFSVVEGVVLAPLPYHQPNRLVMVWENDPAYPRVWDSYPNFLDWRRTAHSFEQIAAFAERGTDLTFPGSPEHMDGLEISSGFFHTLGVNLVIGREFSPEEEWGGGPPVAILSNRLWKDRFAGSPGVLGQTVTLDGAAYTIVGVAPSKFRLGVDADVFTPLAQAAPALLDNRAAHDGIFAFARLASGVTVRQGQAEMDAIQLHLDRLYPVANRDLGIYVEPLKQIIVGDTRGTLLLLLGAVGVVLLIACANVASLLLARSTARTREFAIRSALGANGARVVRQLLTESVLLSLAGAALGLLIAAFGVHSPLDSLLQNLPRSENIAIRFPALIFTLGVSLVVGILFGLAPALKACDPDPHISLRAGGRQRSSPTQHRIQDVLVIVQVALTLVLLVGAGLLFRTIRHLWDVKPGVDVAHLVAFKVGVSSTLTQTPDATRSTYQQLIARIEKIPGVQSAAFTGAVPLSGLVGTMPFWVNSQKPVSLQGAPRVAMVLAGPDYLRTMRIPLLRGRFFTLEDTTKSPCVIVVDAALARTYFPDSDPIGQTLSAGFETVGPCRIVGVVGHVQSLGLGNPASVKLAEAYFPLYQDPDKWVRLEFPETTVVVRTSLDAASLLPSLKATVSQMSDKQIIYGFRTMREILSDSMSPERFPMLLLGVFAGLALVLASVGIYGVISYSVTQRTREIGVRVALGAGKANILRMVIGQGLRLVIAGLAIGAIATLALTRLLSTFSHLLYGVRPCDPVTFAAVALLLLFVSLLACYIPARRAMRVDPLTALRHE